MAEDAASPDRHLVEYDPGSPFPGVIGRTVDESSPAWPAPVRAQEGAPNVLFFMLDDVGYGQLSCFGGLVETPNIDRVAASGLRYANLHTTALCSPTRACFLTGRNHHSNGVAGIMEIATGYPGYDCRMPFENGTLAEILRPEGYNTFCVGKWHLSPSEENSAAGPFNRWPLGRGFERYYGFNGAETNQWYPALIEDNRSVQQPKLPRDGYHLSEDLADHAIGMILDAHVNAPEKPFFLYYATGAAHAPHHVPREWIERYRGRFDAGWDVYRESVFERQKEIGLLAHDAKLPPRDPDVPVWDSLPASEKRVYARMMEVFAGFLSHADHHFGRILDTLERLGELENTIVVVTSDNGASAEGGPHGSVNEYLFFNNIPERFEDNLAKIDELGSPSTYNHYAWGWTWAGDTPFRRWKREVYRGGTTDPCVVAWPSGIAARGEIRHQYAHVIDYVPTVLDALHLDPPKVLRGVTQSPIEGVSFAHTFDAADAPTRHRTQYFEMFGNRAIDHEGWRAVCPWPGPSFADAAQNGRRFGDPISAATLLQLDTTGWELYHISEDPTESTNLAGEHRAKLIELISLWYVEAGKYKVLPLDGTTTARFMAARPQIARPRRRFTYYPGGSVVPPEVAPVVFNRPHAIEAEVEIPEEGAEGVLLAQGGGGGGYTFFVMDGRLRYAHNYAGLEQFEVTAENALSAGLHRLRFEFEPTGAPDLTRGKGSPGHFRLYVDGGLVGTRDVPHTTPLAFEIEGLSCGYDFGGSVLPEVYEPPFTFTGTIHDVAVDLSGELIQDEESKFQMMMANQ